MAIDLSSFLTAADLPHDAVEVARIGLAWGIKGGFKVHPHSAQASAIGSNTTWYVQRAAAPNQPNPAAWLLPIEQLKPQGDVWLAHSSAIADRTAAEQLRNLRVWVARAQFPDLEDDEYYWVDLIGCSVHNLEGEFLGVVDDLMTSGAQATLVLSYQNSAQTQAERLIPFVSAIVQQVDTAAQRIIADWQTDY